MSQCLTKTLGMGPPPRDRVLGCLSEASSLTAAPRSGCVKNRKACSRAKVRRGQLAVSIERMSLVGRGVIHKFILSDPLRACQFLGNILGVLGGPCGGLTSQHRSFLLHVGMRMKDH